MIFPQLSWAGFGTGLHGSRELDPMSNALVNVCCQKNTRKGNTEHILAKGPSYQRICKYTRSPGNPRACAETDSGIRHSSLLELADVSSIG